MHDDPYILQMNNSQKYNNGKKEIIITGFGGQGIILIGRILGMAAALGDNKESCFVQSYGPESRGGACCAQVVIDDDAIHYPYIKSSDILICMSQGGYEKYGGQLNKAGTLIIDTDLVRSYDTVDNFFSIPATQLAEKLGQKMMANIIMVGFFTSITNIISRDSALDTVARSVPGGTEKQNIEAFNKGCNFGLAVIKGKKKKALGQTGVVL